MRVFAWITASCLLLACAKHEALPPSPSRPLTDVASPKLHAHGPTATTKKPAPELDFASWEASPPEKWAAAMTGYVPSVKPGNQLALGSSAKVWAAYLSAVHVRVHPIFADRFVAALRSLPAGNPLSDASLVTRIELVIRDDGTIERMGIVKGSGVADFDRGVLDSFDRAAPFAPPPVETRSADGRAYLHWELHRDDQVCSNINAFPYLLNGP